MVPRNPRPTPSPNRPTTKKRPATLQDDLSCTVRAGPYR
jgi:hypothetical protein